MYCGLVFMNKGVYCSVVLVDIHKDTCGTVLQICSLLVIAILFYFFYSPSVYGYNDSAVL